MISGKSIPLCTLQAAYRTSLYPSSVRFMAASAFPAAAQMRRLKSIIRANADTVFGREHGFSRIFSLEDYRAAVPILKYDDFSPYIDQIEKGEENILTSEPVLMMEQTSGSSSSNKLIPFTAGLLEEISSATHAWLFDLMGYPGLSGTLSYWSISPAGRFKKKTSGGIPIGFDDDTQYFGSISRIILGKMMAVPPGVGQIRNTDRWRWETCRHLLAAENLGLISVWSPTFLTGIMQSIEDNLDDLLACLKPSRASLIEKALNRAGKFTGDSLWPSLALISCWTDGTSAFFMPALRKYFPITPFQPKGLLATEGVVSIPLRNAEAPVPAIAGHFLEFIDPDNPEKKPLLAHELKPGMRLSPVITSSGGLYRYHLGDIVDCIGKYGKLPCIRFEGRTDSVSDLAGEKLNSSVVGKAIDEAVQSFGPGLSFAMLAPELDSPPSYRLYLEGDISEAESRQIADEVEKKLINGVHYAYCRKIGQLGPVSPMIVSGALKALEKRRIREGGNIGEMKPQRLDRRTGWAAFFM